MPDTHVEMWPYDVNTNAYINPWVSNGVARGGKLWANSKQQNSLYNFTWPAGSTAYVYLELDGYEPGKVTVESPSGSAIAKTVVAKIPLKPKPTNKDLKISVKAQPLSGVDIFLTGTASKEAMTSADGVTFKDLALGPYHIRAVKEGYTEFNSDLRIEADAETTIQFDVKMEASDDSGEEGQPDDSEAHFSSNANDDSFDAAVAAAAPPKMDREAFEAIYGNSDWEGYFTSAQARVYIGNMFIDEMQVIQYQLQSNVVPVYGYASRLADAYAEGKSLVQGQLVLNYVSPAYMFTVLDTYENTKSKTDITAAVKDGQDLAKLLAARRAWTRIPGSVMPSIDTHIAEYASNPEAIQAAKKALRKKGFDPVYMNPVYPRVTFDMTIEIGDRETGSYRRLEACRIVSNEQVLDQSGQVIGDAFGFIARRLR